MRGSPLSSTSLPYRPISTHLNYYDDGGCQTRSTDTPREFINAYNLNGSGVGRGDRADDLRDKTCIGVGEYRCGQRWRLNLHGG